MVELLVEYVIFGHMWNFGLNVELWVKSGIFWLNLEFLVNCGILLKCGLFDKFGILF